MRKVYPAFARRLLPCVLVCGIAFLAAPAHAQLFFDHLKCYKLVIKKGQWTANGHALDPLTLTPLQIPPFAQEQGCVLLPKRSPKPKELCIPVDKQPRQNPTGVYLTDDYLCYQMRCPAEVDTPVDLFSQFGSGRPTVKRAAAFRRLCVPAKKGTPEPTPTATPVPTPTVPPQTRCCQFPWSPSPTGFVCLDAVSPDVEAKCAELGGQVLAGVCDPVQERCVDTSDVPPSEFCCECPVLSPPFPHPQFCFESIMAHEQKCQPPCQHLHGFQCDPVSEKCVP